MNDIVKNTLAQKIGKRGSELAPFVALLLEHVSPNSSGFAERFGLLSGHITPAEFEDYFVNFSKGVQYVHEKYGTTMEGYLIGNREHLHMFGSDGDICYIDGTLVNGQPLNDTLMVSREGIGEWAFAKRTNNIGGTGHLKGLTMSEVATALGVEEALHAYQVKILHPDIRALSAEEKQRRLHELRHQMETELTPLIEQAAKDLGFGSAERGIA